MTHRVIYLDDGDTVEVRVGSKGEKNNAAWQDNLRNSIFINFIDCNAVSFSSLFRPTIWLGCGITNNLKQDKLIDKA